MLCLRLDIERDLNAHDVHDVVLWDKLFYSMALGHITSVVAGPKCKTWRSLLQRRTEGLPVQKRERADPWTSIQGSGSQSELDMEPDTVFFDSTWKNVLR